MGWDSGYVPKSIKTIDYIRDYWKNEGKWEVLAIGTGSRQHGESVYYTAVKIIETGEVFAGVTLVKRTKNELAKKTMDETVGPCSYDCPEKVFKLLTPTTRKWAIEWREKVALHLAQKKAAPKIAQGDIVKFAEPIKFTNGLKLDTFAFRGGSHFFIDGLNFRISNWKTRKYEKFIDSDLNVALPLHVGAEAK